MRIFGREVATGIVVGIGAVVFAVATGAFFALVDWNAGAEEVIPKVNPIEVSSGKFIR